CVAIEAVRPQRVILAVVISRAMQVVRARLGGEVGNRGLTPSVLGADGPGLKLKFADRLRRRAELVIRATRQVHPANSDSIDQNFVSILLAAIDRTLPGTTGGSRQCSKDELLDLPPAIADRDRPGIELFLRDVTADLSGPRFKKRRIARHCDRIADIADL